MSQYEQLRRAVLSGAPAAGRAHALFVQRGMACWARAWQGAGLPGRPPAAGGPALPLGSALSGRRAEVACLLAGMALNCVREENREERR